jgi:hypothetical protein
MDDLIAAGVAGLTVLFVGAVLFILGVFQLVVMTAKSFAAGDLGFVAIVCVSILVILVIYTATGFWLRKTDRI